MIFAALPQTPQAPLFIAQLQALTLEHNLTFQSITTSSMPVVPIPDQTNTGQFDFTFEAAGSEADALAFLDSLSHFNRIIKIDNVLFTLSKKSDTDISTVINLKGEAYYKPI